MRYLGSKASTLPQLDRIVRSTGVKGTFCDPFGGVGVVGSYFRSCGYEVHSGDILVAAHCFQVARIATKCIPLPQTVTRALGVHDVREFVAYLNNLPRIKSWVYREFSDKRQYFTAENAQKIDSVRREVWRLAREGIIDGPALAYYLASLIASADKVANTAGTYYAHLKSWDRKSIKTFELEPLAIPQGPGGRAYLVDAAELASMRHFNVLYLDPPYNRRDYAAYYHFPETIATGRRPRPTGTSGVDASHRPSSGFTSKARSAQALRNILEGASFDVLLMHYSKDGMIEQPVLHEILAAHGRIKQHELKATGYSSTGSRKVSHLLYVVSPS